jgi:peptidoglycan/xylan/chitin deacetylase (PgdA/CDA1 family)
MLIEIALPLALSLTLIGGALTLWRRWRGPATRRLNQILRVVVLSLVVMPVVTLVVWRLSKSRTFQFFGGLVPRVETSAPVVALTFDDGPSSQFTEEVLAVLREYDIKATFFVTGEQVEENMAQARQIVEAGHELGNHSYSHPTMMLKPYAFIREEIERTDQAIREAGYAGDIHFRSPYGKRFLALPHYLSRTGRMNIFFDVEPESYGEIAADAEKITAHVLENTRPGSIVLLHVMAEPRDASRAALPGIIQGLQAQGYRFVTVSKLLAFDSATLSKIPHITKTPDS